MIHAAADSRRDLDQQECASAMGKNHPQPQTTLRRYRDGSGWYLEAVGENGVTENIGDFSSEAEANDWVVHKSAAFFKARSRSTSDHTR
jgi:hypothetical protein